jgi:hypothetical protein
MATENNRPPKEAVLSAISELYDKFYDPETPTESDVFKFSPSQQKTTKKEFKPSKPTKPIDIPNGRYNFWSD